MEAVKVDISQVWPRSWAGTVVERTFRRVTGSQVDLAMLQKSGFREPILLTQKDSFGPTVPDQFDVEQLLAYFPPDRKLPVIGARASSMLAR